MKCATGQDLEKALADGKISQEDFDAVEDFKAFLRDPSSRCIICLGDDTEGALWRNHKKHGRVFICQSCLEKHRKEPT